jgi:hypothetical protein
MEKKNKGGRPRKEVTKHKKITVHLTEKEHEALKSKSIRVNMSMSEFLCSCAFKKEIIAIDEGIFKHRAVMRSLSNNVNQIARKVNATGSLNNDDRQVLEELLRKL